MVQTSRPASIHSSRLVAEIAFTLLQLHLKQRLLALLPALLRKKLRLIKQKRKRTMIRML